MSQLKLSVHSVLTKVVISAYLTGCSLGSGIDKQLLSNEQELINNAVLDVSKANERSMLVMLANIFLISQDSLISNLPNNAKGHTQLRSILSSDSDLRSFSKNMQKAYFELVALAAFRSVFTNNGPGRVVMFPGANFNNSTAQWNQGNNRSTWINATWQQLTSRAPTAQEFQECSDLVDDLIADTTTNTMAAVAMGLTTTVAASFAVLAI